MCTTAGEKILDGREAAIKVSFQARRTAAEPPAKGSALAGLHAENIARTIAEKKNYEKNYSPRQRTKPAIRIGTGLKK
jgi:hypothetical protein